MSDLVGNHIVGFPTRRLNCQNSGGLKFGHPNTILGRKSIHVTRNLSEYLMIEFVLNHL